MESVHSLKSGMWSTKIMKSSWNLNSNAPYSSNSSLTESLAMNKKTFLKTTWDPESLLWKSSNLMDAFFEASMLKLLQDRIQLTIHSDFMNPNPHMHASHCHHFQTFLSPHSHLSNLLVLTQLCFQNLWTTTKFNLTSWLRPQLSHLYVHYLCIKIHFIICYLQVAELLCNHTFALIWKWKQVKLQLKLLT